jgi:hypothetical protein
MTLGLGCRIWFSLFVAGFVLTVLGNVLGFVAWRGRAAGQPVWRPMLDFRYLLHAEFYRGDVGQLRTAAVCALAVGAILITAVVVAAITAQATGLSEFCGLSF